MEIYLGNRKKQSAFFLFSVIKFIPLQFHSNALQLTISHGKNVLYDKMSAMESGAEIFQKLVQTTCKPLFFWKIYLSVYYVKSHFLIHTLYTVQPDAQMIHELE